MADTYPMPLDGWVCFHCGERFTTPGAASDHFGARPGSGLACKIKAGDERGLVMELRKAQTERDEARAEVKALREALQDLIPRFVRCAEMSSTQEFVRLAVKKHRAVLTDTAGAEDKQ